MRKINDINYEKRTATCSATFEQLKRMRQFNYFEMISVLSSPKLSEKGETFTILEMARRAHCN